MNTSRFLSAALLSLLAGTAAAQSSRSEADLALDELLMDSSIGTDSGAPAAEAPTATGETNTPEVVDTIPVEPLRAEQPSPSLVEKHLPPQLEEIVVTATKRAAPVRDIPATVNVLSGEDLERQGIQGIDQIVAQVPGVNLMNDDGAGEVKRITVRGIASTPATNLTVGTLFGDIPFSDPFAPKVQLDPNPFDMATVEVLKGPQGTLFGGTGLSGMIRYVPQAPQFDGFHLKYYSQLDAYPGNGDSGWSYGAMVNAPFANQTAALRVVAFNREAPGYTDDTQAGKEDVNRSSQYGFRAILAWQPDDDWKISLLGTMQHSESDDSSYVDNYDGRFQRGNSPRPSPIETDYSLFNLSVERHFDWGDVVSQTSVFEKEFRASIDGSRLALGGRIPLINATTYNHSEGYSQEVRLVSADEGSPWKWLAGAFYYDLSLYDCGDVGALQLPILAQLPNLLRLPILQGVLATPCAQNARSVAGQLDIAQLIGDIDLGEQALFGEVTRRLGENWEATLGARVYRTQTGGTVSRAGALYSSQTGGLPASVDADSEERGVSPKASIAWSPSPDLRTYFTVSRGFRFGGPQLGASSPTTQVPDTYKSDSLWNYELGVRSDWLDRTLRLDASAYRIEWQDAQVRQASSDGLVVFIDNVGGVEGHGVELSLDYLPPFLEGLTLNTSAAWNRTVTTEDFDDAGAGIVPAGSPWPSSPRWQTSTTLAYAFPFTDWRANASLRHSYLGSACNAIACTAQVFGYQTLDLNLTLASLNRPWLPELSLSLNNLTDERGLANVNVTNLSGVLRVDTINYIAPRALVLRLSGSF